MKNLRIAITALILCSVAFNLNYLYRSWTNIRVNYSYSNQRVVMSLPAGDYWEISALNDVLDNKLTSTFKPITVNDVITSRTLGVDFGVFSPTLVENINNDFISRELKLKRVLADDFEVSLTSRFTDSVQTEGFFYYLQLDYSNVYKDLLISDNTLELETNSGCTMKLTAPAGTSLNSFAEDRSIQVVTPLQQEVKLILTISFKC